MLSVAIYLCVAFGFIVLLKWVSMIISERVTLSREELSPYECGFEHHNVSRLPLSLRYFMLTLLFLLFDLEVVFLLFLPASFLSGYPLLAVASLFVLFLLLSLIYEWVDGTLEWVV